MINNPYFIDHSESDMGKCLVLKGQWSDDFINVIREENISILRLSYSAGWKEKDISFLEKLQSSSLRGVEVYSWNVTDITPLKYLPKIEYLGIQCKFTNAPDFSIFRKLRICKLLWRPKAKSVFDCLDLKLLNIVNYPFEDLQTLKKITGLNRLQIKSKKLVSLLGIESLQSLTILDLADCPNLELIMSIEMCQELQLVALESCKKLNNISSIGELEKLKDFILIDCGKIKSLHSLAKCRLLESMTFSGDTNIEDGDLTPLLNLPILKRISFADRLHYTHNRDQIAALL